MIINLQGPVDNEMLNNLIKAFNELKEDILHVYLNTEGGRADTSEAIIDLINNNKERFKISFYGNVFSAGMYIFFRSLCEREILPDTIGMYHYAWQEVTIAEGGKPWSAYDAICMKEMKISKAKTLEYIKNHTSITSKEINDIKKGKDVYFSYERMKQLLDGK